MKLLERDIEQIIKSVAEEVYQKLQAQGGVATATAPVSMGSGNHKILARMNPSMTIDDVKAACDDAKKANVCALCVPQWFIDFACAQLKGTNIKVATVVGLPQGTTSTFAKYAEVKLAVQAGATEIIIPINMTLAAAGDWDGVRKDLADSMTLCDQKAGAYALIEVDSLSCDQVEKAAEAAASCGVEAVLISAVVSGSVTEAQVQAAKKKAVVGVFGGVTANNMGAYANAGATCFAASAI
ncbi:MAG: hypothetical protein KBS79_01785 [Lachnospiraceae bacterium]|nr:hypothetical protein [Candidatus Minthocola equi]